MRVGGRNDTMFSPRWGRCEGAGLGDEAPQTGPAVVGQVDGEGGHCGHMTVENVPGFNFAWYWPET